MLRLLTIAPLSVALIFVVACGDSGGGECVCPAADVLNIGHRGSGNSGEANPWPENTLASIAAALADGADGVEIDVQLSADGTLVSMHDFTVDHTTDGTGCVSELSLEELRALDAGVPAMEGEGVLVPTLAEVLAAFSEGGFLDIELKVDAEGDVCEPTDREATVAALLADLDGFPRERLLVTSFDAEILSLVRAEDASIPVALIGSTLGAIDVAEAEGFDGAAVLYLVVSRSVIEDARARDLDLYVWTLDDELILEDLMSAGLTGVITNAVPTVVEVRESLCGGHSC